MSLSSRLMPLMKKLVFGGERLPDHFFLAQPDPQQEVKVWLIGAGEPIDVTQRHCQASSMPFTVCIGFDRERVPGQSDRSDLRLRLSESTGMHRVLSKIRLRYQETLECGESSFLLFQSSSSTIGCLPRPRLWSHYLRDQHSAWRSGGSSGATLAHRRAVAAMTCCPRPVSLISVADRDGTASISPVNVMGTLSEEFFGFSLPHGSLPETVVQRTRSAVVSSVPMEQAPVPYKLVPSSDGPCLEWKQLGLNTRSSQLLRIPVPLFAGRVRELQVEHVRRLGFHSFFLGRVLSDERTHSSPELCVIHGFYEDWRVKRLGVDKLQADADDLYVRSSTRAPEAISAPG